jgi:hypothetical protein
MRPVRSSRAATDLDEPLLLTAESAVAKPSHPTEVT